MTFPVLPSNTSGCYIPTGKKLTNSLRFRQSASAYLNRTPATTTNTQTFTWSGWVKRGSLGSIQSIFGACQGSGYGTTQKVSVLRIESDDTFTWFEYYSANGVSDNWLYTLNTTQVFRDPSSWYHIVVSFDTTQATASNRIKLFINGVQVTSFATTNYPPQNFNSWINTSSTSMFYGAYGVDGLTYFLDGYIAESYFIDGQALSPTSFGQFDPVTGVWVPMNYTGTYGTNGFYLPFTNTTSPTTLAYDQSGNGNNWTPNNISTTADSTYDAMTDVPTLTSATQANYCVLNPVQTGGTTSNANLTFTATGSSITGTVGTSSNKFYWEITDVVTGDNSYIGIADSTWNLNDNSWSYSQVFVYIGNNGFKGGNGSTAAYGATFAAGDVIGVALDLDAGTLTFYKNNVSQGVAFNTGILGKTFRPFMATSGLGTTTLNANFGQQPFTYTPPAGFKALNTFNLPCPTIWNGANVMAATLYTGNGGTQTISNSANNTIGKTFYPDLTWIKDRSTAQNNVLTDSVRGATQQLISNNSNAATTNANGLTAFSGTGFTVGNDAQYNNNTDALVAWQWNAGNGVTSSNTNGSITSTISVNPTAGFSIVSYTGNGTSGATVGHGLGVTPAMIISKGISAGTEPTTSWWVQHQATGTSVYELNTTNAANSYASVYNNTLPNSSVFTVGNGDPNRSGATQLAYCWAAIPGYSAFGSYTGNGSATAGPFVYLGFRPRYVLIKGTSTSGRDWVICDSSRNTFNGVSNYLYADAASTEGSGFTFANFLSNGFQISGTWLQNNNSGETYIYAAFAENPFKYSLAR